VDTPLQSRPAFFSINFHTQHRRATFHPLKAVMRPIIQRLPRVGRAWKPLIFANSNFERIAPDEKVEEELIPKYTASHYYPVRIGEVLRDRYQIVGKLGFGRSSTVWLARDLDGRRHVALKLFINSAAMGEELDHESSIYRRISNTPANAHPGRAAVRQLLDSFDAAGPDGSHRCLVHPPSWESLLTFLHRNPVRRLPKPLMALSLYQAFLALDFLHTECRLIQTGEFSSLCPLTPTTERLRMPLE